mmetsp:Transcript_49961/g.124228  ORF Transcript_49961/g.124228 Transcript_49961/m.124228 type:complete len:315 (-) Transcript_49961:565-1509(-)
MKFTPPEKRGKRWSACGTCIACTRRDCGTCINCLDKCKFGGAGIRKQSCVQRRCERMSSQACSTGTTPHEEPSTPTDEADVEDDLFWTAVRGCIAMGKPSDDDDLSAAALLSKSDAATPLRTFAALRLLAADRSSQADTLLSDAISESSSFCLKLAAVLASDKRLASQPIAVRALQHAGYVDPVDSTSESQRSVPQLLRALSRGDLVSTYLSVPVDATPPASAPAAAATKDRLTAHLLRSLSFDSQEVLHAESLVALNSSDAESRRRRERIASELTFSLTQLAAAELAAHGVDGTAEASREDSFSPPFTPRVEN